MAASPALVRTAHASGLHAVERELAELHSAMLQTGGDSRMVRLSVLTLVAVCTDDEGAERAEAALSHLARSHPARGIIIIEDPSAANGIEADLSLHCVVGGGSGQVCSERVHLRVSGESSRHLASVVTPLLVPDVPVYLWLVGAPPLDDAFGHAAIAIAEGLIIDSGAYPDTAATLQRLAAEEAAKGDRLPLADIAWTRTQSWRELIAGSFDGPAMRGFLRHVVHAEVESAGGDPSAQLWLLLGWIASRLGWPETGGPEVTTGARDVDGMDDGELVRVRLHCAVDDHRATVSIVRDGEALLTLIEVDGGLNASSTLPVQSGAMVDLVSRQLEESGADPGYAPALRRAAALATAP